MTKVHDPDYPKMREPHATEKEALEALEKFYEAVQKARHEYRIPVVEIIALVKTRYGDKNEKTGEFLSTRRFEYVE